MPENVSGSSRCTKQRERTPVERLPSSFRSTIQAWREARAVEAAASGRRREYEKELRTLLEPIWHDRCRRDRRYHTCLTFDAGDSAMVTVVHMPRGQCVAPDREHEIRAIFGDQDYETYFEHRTFLRIDADQLSDEQAVQLTQAFEDCLGNAWTELVAAEYKVVPRQSYFRDRVIRVELDRKAAAAEKVGLVLPFEPTLNL